MKKPEKLRGLYLRGKTWWFAWTPPDGEREFASMATSDYGEAVLSAMKIVEAIEFHRGERISDERQRFLASKKKSGAYSRHSAEWAETPLKHLETFCGDAGVASITPAKLEAFAEHLRDSHELSESSVASYMRAVRSFFSWIEKRGSIRLSPATGLRLPKVTQSARVEFCSKELRDKLIDGAPNDEMRLIMLLGFHAGLRKGEIIEARPEWIDGKVIHIEKTETFRPKDRERRAVPMTSALVSYFASHPIHSPFLVRPEKKHGAALYRFDFREPFESYMKDQECQWVTPHTMRRTFASLLVSSGVSIYKVARWLGDSVAVAEKHYGHLTVEDADIDRPHITSATRPA